MLEADDEFAFALLFFGDTGAAGFVGGAVELVAGWLAFLLCNVSGAGWLLFLLCNVSRVGLGGAGTDAVGTGAVGTGIVGEPSLAMRDRIVSFRNSSLGVEPKGGGGG